MIARLSRLYICLLVAAVTATLSSIAAGAQDVARGSGADCYYSFTLTAAGAAGPFDNRRTACTTWTLVYNSSGFTSVSIQLESAPDSGGAPGTFAVWANLASGTALPLTSTTSSQATGYKYQPWVRPNALTLTGAGVVNGVLIGWRPAAGSDASASAPSGSPNVSTGGATTVAIAAGVAANTTVKSSPGRLCRVLVTTSGANAMQFTDGAAGTIIGIIPVSAAVGTVIDFQLPAATSIIAVGSATNPAVTVSFN